MLDLVCFAKYMKKITCQTLPKTTEDVTYVTNYVTGITTRINYQILQVYKKDSRDQSTRISLL